MSQTMQPLKVYGGFLGVVSRKVLQYFLLIPQLVKMYRCKSLAKLCTWHKNNVPANGLVRSVIDSITYKHISEKWLEFVNNSHNIRLGLALDKVNPFGSLSSIHSTWLVVLLNYNLFLWLVTKCYFLMLALIIPSK